MDQYEASVPPRIAEFIRKHHVMTLATVSPEGLPWCANIFYSYIAGENLFVFTTGSDTRHGRQLGAGTLIAGSIVLETRNVGLVRGLQLQGYACRPEGEVMRRARTSYISRFPYAAAAQLELWILRPTMFKFTDNRLGFGKKLFWNGDGEE